MNEFLSALKEYWAITMTFIGLVGSYLWLKLDARYVKQSDLSKMKSDMSNIKSRVTHIEEDINQLPTSQDIADLRLAVSEMRGETKALHTELKGLNHLVQLLVEKEVNDK